MLKINHIAGFSDSLPLDPTTLTGDLNTDVKSAYILSLVAGLAVSINATGGVIPCTDPLLFEGFLINDASSAAGENIPALASNKVGVLCGGGVIITDQVIQNDIAAGDKLFLGAGGKLTNIDPTGVPVIGIARTSNSVSDLSVTVRF